MLAHRALAALLALAALDADALLRADARRRRPPSALGAEVLPAPSDGAPAPVSAALPGVLRVAHCDGGDAAYAVAPAGGAAGLLVGVPAAGALAAVEAHCRGAPATWFLPGRVGDGAAQEAVRAAFPDARRVVHRMDAGRGAYRRDDDLLLSAAGARLTFRAKDAGVTTTRARDDGPWALAPTLAARWCPGPSQGACALVADVGGQRALFSGRLAGHDGRAGAVAPFALEGEHSAAAHAASLRAVARAGDDWDFTWLLPGRGDAVRFESPAAARAALEAAADAAAAMAARGA